MKIAVIGNGPVALEAAVEFLHEGADVRVLGRGELGSKIKSLKELFPNDPIEAQKFIRPKMAEIIGLDSQKDMTTFPELWESYYAKMIELVGGRFSQRNVERIQKRFLHKEEVIDGRSRLLDLFRVTSALNPSGMVEEQVRENPELKEKLGEDILNSLKNQVESFEDFDLVFDCRGPFQKPLPLGTGEQYALNEKTIAELGQFHYGRDAFIKLDQIQEESQTITLVGGGEMAAQFLLGLEAWLKEPKNILNIISERGRAFDEFLSDDSISDDVKIRLKEFISSRMKSWREKCQETEEAIKRWRDLPDFERVKIPQPQFPDPQLRIFEGYSVSSCDKLIDQKQTYLTLEIPPWRDPEDEKKEILTLGQDSVVILKGSLRDLDVARPHLSDEPGYFALFDESFKTPGDAFASLDQAREKVFQFFSKA